MRLSLRAKTGIAFFLAALIGFSVLVLFWSLAEKQQESSTVRMLNQKVNLVASSSLFTEADAEETLHTTASMLNASVWVTDVKGQVLLSAGDLEAPRFIPEFNTDFATLSYLSGRFFNTLEKDAVTVFSPVSTNLRIDGYVFIHYDRSRISSAAKEMMLFAFIIYGVMAVLLVILYIILEITVFSRAEKLSEGGKELCNGNLSYPLSVSGRDELADIAEHEKLLASQVGSASEDQKKFLANISHDFRSPLTSIQGYVTAMQDGTIPPEMYEKYLGVVLSETDRLKSLSNGLLNITEVEKGMLIEKQIFDLNSLIRDILPAFEGRVQEKDIAFDLTFEAESQFVNADAERIGQVLHNLIDNAIKFSKEHSEIALQTKLQGTKVFVSVRDHGVGIPKESLPKIWNRFYKTDPSRGKDKKGTGLGLSIVREIIQAHKEHIDCISTPGVGTEFIFTLEAAE